MGTPDQLFLQFAEACASASYGATGSASTSYGATGSPFAEAMADKTTRPTFNYRVRENRRAKRIILRVTVTHGLEVVVPSAAARRQIPVWGVASDGGARPPGPRHRNVHRST